MRTAIKSAVKAMGKTAQRVMASQNQVKEKLGDLFKEQKEK